jgi:azurin
LVFLFTIGLKELLQQGFWHNFVLLKKGKDPAKFANASAAHKPDGYIDPELADWIIARTDMVGGGDKDSVIFQAPSDPGEYEYVCTFPGHFAAGMRGILKVELK